MITKEMILKAMEIAGYIKELSEKKGGKLTSDDYNRKIKPLINRFKSNYGDTPNNIFSKFLRKNFKTFIENEKYNCEVNSKSFYSRNVNDYCWTYILAKSKRVNNSPLLFI